jgi:hypothetical protein
MDAVCEIDPRIEALGLTPNAKAFAYAYIEQFGSRPTGARIVRGRCDRAGEARAIAQDIVAKGNRRFIADVYAAEPVEARMQQWVDSNPQAVTIADLEIGLLEQINAFGDDQLAHLSAHLGGNALDPEPVPAEEDERIAWMQAQPNVKLVLKREGGMLRWHVEIREAAAPPQLEAA